LDEHLKLSFDLVGEGVLHFSDLRYVLGQDVMALLDLLVLLEDELLEQFNNFTKLVVLECARLLARREHNESVFF
jgi:hypothetical protein